MSVFATWFVCALGATVFAACGHVSRRSLAAAAGTFAAAAWLARTPLAPSLPAIGVFTAVTAALVLFPRRRIGGPTLAGVAAAVLAGLWTGALTAQGLPLVVAVALALALPLLSMWLREHRARFAPPLLRDEALVLLIVLGLAAGSVPAIADGWRAAANLSLGAGAGEAAGMAVPAWALALTFAALAAGCLSSLWSRR